MFFKDDFSSDAFAASSGLPSFFQNQGTTIHEGLQGFEELGGDLEDELGDEPDDAANDETFGGDDDTFGDYAPEDLPDFFKSTSSANDLDDLSLSISNILSPSKTQSVVTKLGTEDLF